MPIEPITGAPALAAGTRARRRQTGFAVPDPATQAGEALAVAAPAEAAAAQMPLLTLHAAGMADAQAEADRSAARQGEGALEAMRGLQLAMLGGDGAGQAAFATLPAHLPHAADPALHAVLQAIAQRAAIERARRE
jgi:hypothetical protein